MKLGPLLPPPTLRASVLASGALSIWLMAPLARADEPRKVSEPRMMQESTELTQVVDAFDDGDPFDLHLSLGYQYSSRSGNIRRETAIAQPGLSVGGYTSDQMNVAAWRETTSRLNTKAQVGLYRDIALTFRLPIILSWDSDLSALSGSDKVQSTVLAGVPGEQLFRLPFSSPTRSGIEYLAVGLDFGIFEQYRDPTKPTWVLGVEGRFSVSEPLHACNPSKRKLNAWAPDQPVDCAYPSDVNRNGRSGELAIDDGGVNGSLEGNFSGSRKPGVSRGTTGLEAHTYVSKRIKYVEPYAGFRALVEFASSDSEYGKADYKGSLVNHPPLRGTMLAGVTVFPYEVRDAFQRLALDFRFTGTYVSEGRDYSPLFDALGSSDAYSLRQPTFAEYQRCPDGANCNGAHSVVNPNSSRVYFTGLTDVQQHGEYTLSTELTWQVGEYVKFGLGAAYTIIQSHFITFDQGCNPDHTDNLGKSGPCAVDLGDGRKRATGIPNPNYRAPINAPGRRFKLDDAGGFDGWVNATVMF